MSLFFLLVISALMSWKHLGRSCTNATNMLFPAKGSLQKILCCTESFIEHLPLLLLEITLLQAQYSFPMKVVNVPEPVMK